jgi:hypothetical protein
MQSRNSWIKTSDVCGPALTVLIVFCLGACSRSDNLPIAQHDLAVAPDARPSLAHPVTVSGVSSGGYMAVQTHVALSDRVAGVGVVAGGPYHCAAGSVGNALGRCMSGDDLEVAPLITFTRAAAESGEISATEFLREAKVWIFHSAKDQIVGRSVAVALADFYREFLSAEQISFVDDIDAAHGWPTLDTGKDCLEIGGDFINACEFDTAGNLLNHLYENLNPRVVETGGEELASIDLSGYLESGSGIADTGYIFVPNECRQLDADCRLHISFHGCRQGAEFVDDRFAVNSGLNEWAAQNRIVVVYPQIVSSLMNPQGCWDWWGYTGPQYDRKSGKQLSGMDAIITAFAQQQLYQSNAE